MPARGIGVPGFRWPDDRLSQADDNFVTNPDFHIPQRGQTFTATTIYSNRDAGPIFDAWILLSDGNDVVDLSREGTIRPEMSRASMKCDVQTINKKFGFLHILENHDAWQFRDQYASLQFQARTTSGAAISNLRAALLSWDSTTNVPTRDVVSAWNAAGTDPTLVANWTYENSGFNIPVSVDSFQIHKLEAIPIDTSGMNNLAVFIWVDDTDAAANDLLYLSNVKLNLGKKCTRFTFRPWVAELSMCYRRFWTSYDLGTSPGTTNVNNGSKAYLTSAPNTILFGLGRDLPVAMLGAPGTVPTVIWYSPTGATQNQVQNITDGTTINTPGTTLHGHKFSGVPLATANVATTKDIRCHCTVDAEM